MLTETDLSLCLFASIVLFYMYLLCLLLNTSVLLSASPEKKKRGQRSKSEDRTAVRGVKQGITVRDSAVQSKPCWSFIANVCGEAGNAKRTHVIIQTS